MQPNWAIKNAAAFHSVLMYSALIFLSLNIMYRYICQNEYHNSQREIRQQATLVCYQRCKLLPAQNSLVIGRIVVDDEEQNNNTFFCVCAVTTAMLLMLVVWLVVSSSIALVRGDLFWFLCSLLSPTAFLILLNISFFSAFCTI